MESQIRLNKFGRKVSQNAIEALVKQPYLYILKLMRTGLDLFIYISEGAPAAAAKSSTTAKPSAKDSTGKKTHCSYFIHVWFRQL